MVAEGEETSPLAVTQGFSRCESGQSPQNLVDSDCALCVAELATTVAVCVTAALPDRVASVAGQQDAERAPDLCCLRKRDKAPL